jgi:nitroreductase
MTGPGMGQESNSVLDRILESRRSVRSFKADIPPKELIKEVIRAGLLAPYAAQAVAGQKDFRRFVIIRRDGPAMARAAEMIKSGVKRLHGQLKAEMGGTPFLQERGEAFLKRLEAMSYQGVLGVGTAPYYIVVAERKGIPPIEQQSLAHCLENMWLKATALGLGFHLVSATAQMAEDKDFCDMLRIPYGEYELNGCAVGYPEKILPSTPRPNADEVTYWID